MFLALQIIENSRFVFKNEKFIEEFKVLKLMDMIESSFSIDIYNEIIEESKTLNSVQKSDIFAFLILCDSCDEKLKMQLIDMFIDLIESDEEFDNLELVSDYILSCDMNTKTEKMLNALKKANIENFEVMEKMNFKQD